MSAEILALLLIWCFFVSKRDIFGFISEPFRCVPNGPVSNSHSQRRSGGRSVRVSLTAWQISLHPQVFLPFFFFLLSHLLLDRLNHAAAALKKEPLQQLYLDSCESQRVFFLLWLLYFSCCTLKQKKNKQTQTLQPKWKISVVWHRWSNDVDSIQMWLESCVHQGVVHQWARLVAPVVGAYGAVTAVKLST